ncbi:MAG: hypothetical protein ACLF0G_09725 [Candidatus Brocadiia bacterium]
MSRRLIPIVLAILALGSAALAGQANVEDYLPADAYLAVTYHGDNPDIGETAMARLIAEPDVQRCLTSVRQSMATGAQMLAMFLKIDVKPLRHLLGSQMGLALLPPGEGPGPPVNLVLAARVGGAEAEARQGVERLLGQLKQRMRQMGQEPPTVQVGGVEAMVLGGGPMRLHLGFHGECLVAATSRQVLASALSADAPKLPGLAGYRRVDAAAGSPVAVVFYNHAALIDHLRRRNVPLPAPVAAVLKGTGLDAAQAVFLRLGANGRALVGTAAITTRGQRQGLLGVLDATPVDRSLLRLVPRGSSVAMATSAEPARVYDGVLQMLASFGGPGEDVRGGLEEWGEQAGVDLRRDLFAQMGRGTVVATSGQPSLLPALVVSQPVADGARFEASVEKLVATLDAYVKEERGPGNAAELRAIAFGDHTIRYLATPGVPVPLAPCFARVGDRMVFALTPIHLKDYLAFLDAGEPSVLDDPEYQKLAERVPENAVCVSYSEAGENFVQLYSTLGPLLTMLQGIPNNPVPLDFANLPSPRTVRQHMFGAISYVVVGDDLVLYECQSPFGTGMISNAPSVAVTAILAGMLLPALARARTEARIIRDRNQLNHIARACATYLNEHGDNRRYPTGLRELVEKELLPRDLLVSPLDRDPPKLPDGTPCSYVSCFEKYPDRVFLDNFPPNAMMAWDRVPFVRGQRNVLFFDSHVERVDEARFQELLDQLARQVEELTEPRKGGEL